jgi:hypothetical protein
MPVISMFYGIIIRMFSLDNKRHHTPHLHAYYQDESVVISLEDGCILEG